MSLLVLCSEEMLNIKQFCVHIPNDCVFQSGHMPCVRVWEVSGVHVAEVQSHKYGVSCVAFSTNSCYIISVGYQYDMTVSVWDWRVRTCSDTQ